MKQVKVCLGRFQPFTLGHLKMATYKDLKGPDLEQKNILREQPNLKEIANQKTIILAISTPNEKVDNRHPFNDDLMKDELDLLKRNYSSEIEDIIYVKSADICAWGELLKEKGYQASVLLTGSDEFKFYKGMSIKVPEYEEKNRDNRDVKGAYTNSFYVEEIKRTDNGDFVSSISGTKVRQALLNGDKELFTKMMPKGADKYFDKFKEALENVSESKKKTTKKKIKEGMISLKNYIFKSNNKQLSDFIKESLNIFEGGNAIHAEPIPAIIAPKIYDEIEKKVHSISKFKDIDMAALGSIGKKSDNQTNGDIDIAVRVNTKDELNEIVNTCFGDCEINYNTMKTITSFGYKYDIDGYKGIAQVDFMIVKRMDWAKAYYHSPNLKTGESKYKGAIRTAALADIIACIPVPNVKDEYFEDGVTLKKHWKHTFNTEGVFIQLVDYCGKNGKPIKSGKKLKEFEKLVTNDPTNLVRFIFGDNGTLKDINSIESLWKAVHDPKKFIWGDDIVEKIEKKIIEDKSLVDKIDKADFPCKFYNV